MKQFSRIPILLLLLWNIHSSFGHPCFFWEEAQYYDSFCYGLSNVSGNWSFAKANCESRHGYLAHPTCDIKTRFLLDMVMVSQKNFDWWIGHVLKDSGSVRYDRSCQDHDPPPKDRDLCPYISASNTMMELPSVQNGSCEETKHFICAKCVGNPCSQIEMPEGEIYNGTCYHFHQEQMKWDATTKFCRNRSAALAEFRQREPYDYFKTRLVHLNEIQVTTQVNESKYISDYNVTLYKEVTFYVVSCGSTRVHLFNGTGSSSPDGSKGRRARELQGVGYIQIHFLWTEDNTNMTIQICQPNETGHACSVLDQRPLDKFDCTKRAFVQIKGDFSVTVNSVTITIPLDKTHQQMITDSSDMVLLTESTTGVWYFPKYQYDPFVSLGATDLLESRVFRWQSNNENVSINDWNQGEPSDKNEHYLTWQLNRNMNRTIGLNDLRDWGAWPFISKNALSFNYIMVLPRNEADNSSHLEVVVTSEKLELAYLFFHQMGNMSFVLSRVQGWANLHRKETFQVADDTDVREGISTSFFVLYSTHDVTVIGHRRQDHADFPIVTFPNNIPGRDYCLAVNETCAIDYFTVTPLGNLTNVTFVFRDAKWSHPLSQVGGVRNTALVTLGFLETLHIVPGGRMNTGLSVHANDTVAVYVWTNCTRSYVTLLSPKAGPFRCLGTALHCPCRCNITRSLSTARQEAKSIQKRLKVPLSETGAYERTKISAPDPRPSSQGMGALGITILVFVFTALIAADVVQVICYVYKLFRNMARRKINGVN